jgi:hypothetical protein
MSDHRCPGCGAAAQKTKEGGRLRWLEPEPHASGTFIVLDGGEYDGTPQSRYAGLFDIDDVDEKRYHLHACDLATAAAYAAAQRRPPTRRSRRIADHEAMLAADRGKRR